MSDWVHCNSCFRQPGDGSKYSLTNCGHIYCGHCVDTDAKEKCKLCGNTKCTTIQLTSKMKPDVEKFFCDPSELLKRHQSEMTQVLDFQKSHRQRLTSYHRQKMNKQSAMLQQTHRAVEQCRDLERKNQVINEENIYLKKLISSMGGSQGGRGTPGKQLIHRSQSQGASPSMSTSVMSPAYSNSQRTTHYPRTPGDDRSLRSPLDGTQAKRLSVRPPPSQGRIGTPGMTPSPSQHSRYHNTPGSVSNRDMSPMTCSPSYSRASGATPGVPIGPSTPGWREGGSLAVFATPGSQMSTGRINYLNTSQSGGTPRYGRQGSNRGAGDMRRS